MSPERSEPSDDLDADDITQDLTIDGGDLLAALREEHAARTADPSAQSVPDPDPHLDEELTVDGRELLAEIKRNIAADGVEPKTSGAHDGDETLERWRPAPVLPSSDEVVAPRAGRASRMQLGIIATVVATAFAVGGYLIVGIVTSDADPDPAGDVAEAETDAGQGESE